MRSELTRSVGFCHGTRRVVQMAKVAAEGGRPCVILGSIIHNRDVTAYLESIGVGPVGTPGEVPPGAAVLIRSHGEGRPAHEALARLGRSVTDATCPNVSRMHQTVSRAEEGGRQVLITGTCIYPKVAATAGRCWRLMVLERAEELSNWLETAPGWQDIPLTMASQTTFARFIWDSCVEKAKKERTSLKIFDTICNATCKRQSEVQALATCLDVMVVTGGREGSNTKRLAGLCGVLRPMIVWIGRAVELEPPNLCRKASIGITVGASTPERIIKEVYDKMSDENIKIEEPFTEILGRLIRTPNTREKVTGIVAGIAPTEVYVDLSTKHAGYIPVSELIDDPTAKVKDLVKVGDEIETYAMRMNDQEGMVTLSKRRSDTVKSWDDIEQAREEHAAVESVVTKENKGDVVMSIKGVRAFVLAPQIGLPRKTPMSQLLRRYARLRIIEVNRTCRRMVGPIRAVEAEECTAKTAEVWVSIEENKRYTGTMKSLTSYGAFVNVGGMDGMVHIPKLSWSRIRHPSRVVSVGGIVEVYIISLDKERKKISLGMKSHSQSPWEMSTSRYQPGDVTNIYTVKLITFGTFAKVVPGVDDLIHISQIADHHIDRPGSALSEGQMVGAKITDIDYDDKKVSPSIRALLEDDDEPAEFENVNKG